MLLGVAGVMTFGFYKVGKGIRELKYVSFSTPSACGSERSWFGAAVIWKMDQRVVGATGQNGLSGREDLD